MGSGLRAVAPRCLSRENAGRTMTVMNHALCGDDFHQTPDSIIFRGKCSMVRGVVVGGWGGCRWMVDGRISITLRTVTVFSGTCASGRISRLTGIAKWKG